MTSAMERLVANEEALMQPIGLVPAIAVMAGKADQIVKAADLHDEILNRVIDLESGFTQFRISTLEDMSVKIENPPTTSK